MLSASPSQLWKKEDFIVNLEDVGKIHSRGKDLYEKDEIHFYGQKPVLSSSRMSFSRALAH